MKALVYILFILECIVALGALYGGIGLLTNNLGMSAELLSNSPFANFTIPGLILLIGVGGSFIAAAYSAHTKHTNFTFFSYFAAFVLNMWIFAEVMLVMERSWLQWFMYGLSLSILLLIMLYEYNFSKLSHK